MIPCKLLGGSLLSCMWLTVISYAGAEHCITSDHILELEEIPKRLAVIGAGYIGVEFGGIFKNLGSHVEFFLRRDKVLNGFDEEVRCGLFFEFCAFSFAGWIDAILS
jgi:pyruvate/2-oxoglutarate dehydrogenase complex dihydrolipoamide dehydrogenase (E3) component